MLVHKSEERSEFYAEITVNAALISIALGKCRPLFTLKSLYDNYR